MEYLERASLRIRGMWLPRRSLLSYSRMLTMPAIPMPCGPSAVSCKNEDGNTVRLYRVGHTSNRHPDSNPIHMSTPPRPCAPLPLQSHPTLFRLDWNKPPLTSATPPSARLVNQWPGCQRQQLISCWLQARLPRRF